MKPILVCLVTMVMWLKGCCPIVFGFDWMFCCIYPRGRDDRNSLKHQAGLPLKLLFQWASVLGCLTVRPTEAGPAEVRHAEVRSMEVRPAKVRPPRPARRRFARIVSFSFRHRFHAAVPCRITRTCWESAMQRAYSVC